LVPGQIAFLTFNWPWAGNSQPNASRNVGKNFNTPFGIPPNLIPTKASSKPIFSFLGIRFLREMGSPFLIGKILLAQWNYLPSF